jgi:hypothetical protein
MSRASDCKTRVAVTDPREGGTDSTAGSGHRPGVVVGATIHPAKNRAFRLASGPTRPAAGLLSGTAAVAILRFFWRRIMVAFFGSE